MKRIILSSMVLSSLLLANGENHIALGGGIVEIKDNFSTEQKSKISSLDSSENKRVGIGVLDFYYGYNLMEDVDIYTSIQEDGIKLGSKIDTNYGIFDFGVMVRGEEEWENPFLIGDDRKTTHSIESGAYLAYTKLFGEDSITIKSEISHKSYTEDKVSKDLKREGLRNKISVINKFNRKLFDRDIAYITKLTFEKYDADGESSSFNKYGGTLGVALDINEKFNLGLYTNLAQQKYEKFNSEVNKKVDVTIYGISAVLKYDKPFGYKNSYVTLNTGYIKEEANTNFYDKQKNYSLITLGYRF